MDKIFKWFNGKKTAIGCALLLIAQFFTQTEIGAGEEWQATLVEALNWIGMALGGTGLVHKGIKSAKSDATP